VTLNLEAQKVAEQSHYKVYKQLIELRKTPTIQQGATQVAALSPNVLGFTRYVHLNTKHLFPFML
jgi:alpha-glucosidase